MTARTWLLLVACALGPAAAAAAQPASGTSLDRFVGSPIVSVSVRSLGQDVRDPQVAGLLALVPGEPLSMSAIRRTVIRLMGLGVYLDVQVRGRLETGGVHLALDLVPIREVNRVVFRGETGVPEKLLRDAVTARFGSQLSPGRTTDIARTLEETYRDHGFLRASVQPRPIDDPMSAPGDLSFDVAPGPKAVLRAVSFRGAPEATVQDVRTRLGLAAGSSYEPAALRRRLGEFVDALRKAGFLEARIDPIARIDDTASAVDLAISVTRGSRVEVVFAGDPLPPKDRDTLVPVAREASADQDLLEDSELRIENYLRAQGYRDAKAPFTRKASGDRLTIVFTVARGPLYRLAGIELAGASGIGPDELRPLVRSRPGDPFVASRLAADVSTLLDEYRRRGYAQAAVAPSTRRGEPLPGASDVPVTVTLTVTEGVRTTVRIVSFEGAQVLADPELRQLVRAREGDPFYPPSIDADRERVLTEYRNRGHRLAAVEARVDISSTGADADLRFAIREGPQILVDRILVVGNTRTSEATIRRELALQSGDALGDAAVAESQRRLAELGLFRRVTISELQHGAEGLRDVLITVEEAPVTTLGYGGGVEFQKVESSEFAPRGFVEIGRRNLWGKNRAVNLFSRISLRRRSDSATTASVGPDAAQANTDLEYRVIGSYREPKFLDTRGDLQVAVVFEQGSRTSFRFTHRSARIDFAERVGEHWRAIGQFAISRNEVFEEAINPIDRPLIDRLFPQVRLSSIAGTAARDTRDDPFAPGRGSLVSLNGELAMRLLGSEVGFAKTFLQGFVYRRLASAPRFVLAGGARVGLGTGLTRAVTIGDSADPNAPSIKVRDLPISERFFAGGDTTVRGFQLDHLGTPETFDRDGTPIGGHAELILNGETRIGLWRDLGIVAFLDAGNVFRIVNDFRFTDLRAGTGFGLRYKSPVGPIRVDLGFKLGTLRTFGDQREDRFALHISIGQAF